MQMLKVKNLNEYQHYKQRNPPWIKLHQTLLEDYEFTNLPDSCKWHLTGILLLASRIGNEFPADPKWIGARISARTKVELGPLIEGGFLVKIGEDDATDKAPAKSKKSVKSAEPAEDLPVKEIIDHLNRRTGSGFSHEGARNIKHIRARFREGHKLEDFIDVIDSRCAVWLHDPKMKDFLRPSTLFNSEKFEGYLGQVKRKPASSGDGPIITDEELERRMLREISSELTSEVENE